MERYCVLGGVCSLDVELNGFIALRSSNDSRRKGMLLLEY